MPTWQRGSFITQAIGGCKDPCIESMEWILAQEAEVVPSCCTEEKAAFDLASASCLVTWCLRATSRKSGGTTVDTCQDVHGV